MVKPTDFEVFSKRSGDEARIGVRGELDIATAPRLEDAVARQLDTAARSVLIDLRRVGFIDSSGLRLLIELHGRSASEGWTLGIVRPGEQAFAVFRITGADSQLPFVEG